MAHPRFHKRTTLTEYPRYQEASERMKGTQFALATNLTPEANERRAAGLIKTWKILAEKAANGEAVIAAYHPYTQRKFKYMKRRAPRHPRIRLRQTVAREAREIQDLARTHADQAMKRMAEIINDPHSPDNIAVAAAEVIFNRAYGKPNQTNTNLNVDANGKPTEVSGTELDKRIAEALKRVEAIAGRAPKAAEGKKQPADLRKLDRNPHGSNEPVH
jgi:hypothetical protein